MGVAVGDYDNSGRFSLFVTNFSEEYNASIATKAIISPTCRSPRRPRRRSLPYVGWGTAFFDYDNDGLLDIIVVNGHVYPQLDKARLGASAGYRQRKLLYHNRGDGTFDDVSAQFGQGADRGAREPRPRGRRHRQRRAPGHRDQRPRRRPSAPAQRVSRRGQLAAREADGQRGNLDAIGAVVRSRAGS